MRTLVMLRIYSRLLGVTVEQLCMEIYHSLESFLVCTAERDQARTTISSISCVSVMWIEHKFGMCVMSVKSSRERCVAARRSSITRNAKLGDDMRGIAGISGLDSDKA